MKIERDTTLSTPQELREGMNLVAAFARDVAARYRPELPPIEIGVAGVRVVLADDCGVLVISDHATTPSDFQDGVGPQELAAIAGLLLGVACAQAAVLAATREFAETEAAL